MSKKRKSLTVLFFMFWVCISVFFAWPDTAFSGNDAGYYGGYYERTYLEYLEKNGYIMEGPEEMSLPQVSVDIKSHTVSEGMKAQSEDDGVITGDNGKITWHFNIETPGFYNVEITYLPIKGTNSDIERKLYINNTIYFKGMEQIILKRLWDNSGKKPIIERFGNEIRPISSEIPEWTKAYVSDSRRRNLEPYKFYLDTGRHALTLESVKEPVKIGKIVFKKAPEPESYRETIDALKEKYDVYKGENIICQAERIEGGTKKIMKSSQSIGVLTDYTSPATVPYHPYKIRLNTIGGNNWRITGDFIRWRIEVPEEGLYRLSFRARQSSNRGVTSYRLLKINGKVPFKEAEKIKFEFSPKFKNYILGDETGEYLFYFKKGMNYITLESVIGDFARPLSEVEESLFILNELYRKTIQITGLVPDRYIDYEISKKIPGYAERIKEESERLKGIVEELVRITGEKGQKTAIVEKMALQAESIGNDPETVINELNAFKSNISALGTWIISISEMPLEIDSFTLFSLSSNIPEAQAGVFKRVYNGIVRFLSTFFVDETRISNTDDKNALKVWVPSGFDQAQIIRSQIDDSFVTETNTQVNLQLIPEDVLLPATLAGTGPDVVISLNQGKIIDFAARNALTDLSKFEGFDEKRKKFFDSAIRTLTFQGGVYALPEQQSFLMMFYREDILGELGLEVPQTWDEVESMISILNINNYTFFIPYNEIYPTLVFQHGEEMYGGEGNDYGISSRLSSDKSMDAFSRLTNFFTSYRLPVQADFSNRFRTGEIPAGIAQYTTFNQLEVFAPEIKGMWNFAPVPGIRQDDGTINNTVVATTPQNSAIMISSKNKKAGWDFIKWWLDTETQVRYANTLEDVMGIAARYASANIDVVRQLHWTTKQSRQLVEQFASTQGVPDVPGAYMTSRMIDYAFKAVVTSGDNPREQLYLKVKEINKELTKKRKEFNLSYYRENE